LASSGLLLSGFTHRNRLGGGFMGLNRDRGNSRSKFRPTQRRGREVLSTIQTQIPEPLVQDLPALLSTSAMRAPTICVLFLIFIRENGFK
jgi:hypothetical protein